MYHWCVNSGFEKSEVINWNLRVLITMLITEYSLFENAQSLQMYCICNDCVVFYKKETGGRLYGKYDSGKSGR